jgi:malonyl-CoA O-methyltransferase
VSHEPPPRRAASVSQGYDLWSVIYDHEENPLITLEEPLVRERLADVAGKDALDLGCGTGRHSLRLASRGARVTAVDFSEGMLAEAQLKPGASAVRFVRHDLHRPLPFPEASFDLVVSGLVLEHLRALPPFFAEIRRVLRPGGRALVTAMHPAMLLRGVRARFLDPASGDKIEPGSEPHQLGDFVMAAVRAGLVLEDVVERAHDEETVKRCPRATKYIGWPMLAVLDLSAPR